MFVYIQYSMYIKRNKFPQSIWLVILVALKPITINIRSSILDAFCDIEEEEEEFKFSLKFRVFDFLVSLDLNLRFLTFW